ncbi:response regulator [Aquimarina sp. 2201CG14-23]|uniref:response regulator n=1 Tax=Aquimarina mycalae TaxID=3040073 RepID=UPI002477EBEF|nr:response regulator [Aquimarina sp. 2201CG14-23]MDH7446248.1 response regulator [Aquimarina sp. 2201CG14-23]
MGDKIGVACIIDDDSVYVNLVKRIIEAKQLCQNLLIFENGKEALGYFEAILSNMNEESIPEIIFLDLNMPIMDGWEFLANFTNIKNRFGKVITLYIVSSSINPLDIKKTKSINGIKDYLIKPITIGELESIFSAV